MPERPWPASGLPLLSGRIRCDRFLVGGAATGITNGENGFQSRKRPMYECSYVDRNSHRPYCAARRIEIDVR